MPLISVIIPTYGKPVFLEKAIESVLTQSFADLELLVVDDNNPSTEARKLTEEILSKIVHKDHRVHYLKHEKNMNGAVARNTGIAKAQGKYISFLDSDDEYIGNRLERCYSVMEQADKSVAGVYSGCEYRKNGETYHIECKIESGNFLIDTLACKWAMFGTGSNLFVRKTVVDEINGFDGTFLRHQDYEFLVRIFEKYQLMAIPEVLVIKNNENFNFPNLQKSIDIKKQYLNKFRYIIEALPIDKQKYIYYTQYVQVAEIAMKNKNRKIAREYYAKARQYRALTFKDLLRSIAFVFSKGR